MKEKMREVYRYEAVIIRLLLAIERKERFMLDYEHNRSRVIRDDEVTPHIKALVEQGKVLLGPIGALPPWTLQDVAYGGTAGTAHLRFARNRWNIPYHTVSVPEKHYLLYYVDLLELTDMNALLSLPLQQALAKTRAFLGHSGGSSLLKFRDKKRSERPSPAPAPKDDEPSEPSLKELLATASKLLQAAASRL